MTTEQTRETMNAYADALLAFGDYARYLSDEVTMTFMGTDRAVKGRDAVRQTIDFFHETAFSSAIEVKSVLCGAGEAMLEAEFIGAHVGEFEGVPPTLRPGASALQRRLHAGGRTDYRPAPVPSHSNC